MENDLTNHALVFKWLLTLYCCNAKKAFFLFCSHICANQPTNQPTTTNSLFHGLKFWSSIRKERTEIRFRSDRSYDNLQQSSFFPSSSHKADRPICTHVVEMRIERTDETSFYLTHAQTIKLLEAHKFLHSFFIFE